MATEKETIILDFQVEQGDAISELEKTKKSIIGLKKEQQELNKAYKEGNVDLDEYAAEQVRLEAILKKQTNQYNTVQKSVTGVTTQFDKLINSNKWIQKSLESTSGSLAALVPGFSGAASGVTSVTTASKAFIATPIGAVIGALGLAIAALTQYFRDNEAGQNSFNRIMNVGSAIVGKFTDLISFLGENVFKVLISGFETTIGFLEKWIPGFAQATKAVEKFLNLDRANYISDLESETDELERQLIVRKAQLEAIVAEQKLRAEDKSLSLKDRKKALDEASKSQRELNDLELKFAENKLKIIQAQNAQSNSNKDALKAEAEAQANLFRIQKDAADKQKEIFTKSQEIKAQEAALTVKVNEQLARELELKNQLILVTERLAQTEDVSLKIAEQSANIKGKIDADAVNRIVKKNEIVAKAAKQEAQVDFLLGQQKLANASTVFNQVKGLINEETAAYKALAIAQASIDTYRAATAALAPPPVGAGPLFGPILAATTIALGLANVAKIAGLSAAAGGGKFVTKGPALLMVGDNPGGVERVTVEPISGRGKTVVNGNLAKMAGGGVLETQSVTGPINASMAFRSTMDRQPIVYASWKEATELNNRIQFKESLITA